MSHILMIGCAAAGNVLVSLDDHSVWTDEGVAYEGHKVTDAIDFGRTAYAGRLRRIAQAVSLQGEAEVEIVPYGDGSEYEEQANAYTLNATDGETQILEVPVAVDAYRFQYRTTVRNFTNAVELGSADLAMIPKPVGGG